MATTGLIVQEVIAFPITIIACSCSLVRQTSTLDFRLRFLLVLVTVFIVFGQTLGHGFVNYDDDQYFYANPHVFAGLTWHGVMWAFQSEYANNWHPLMYGAHVRRAMIRPRHDWSASDQCLRPRCAAAAVAANYQRGSGEAGRSRSSCGSCCCSLVPFRRVTRFKFNVEASTVSGHQPVNLKRPFFEK